MGCGCIVALIAGLSPRLALLLTWLLTNRVAIAFHHSLIVPLLGIIFLPMTTLMYVWVYSPVLGVGSWGWVFVILGLVVDLGSYSAGSRTAPGRAAR
ncbi:hypothetical protein BIV57_14475 [Mangrovactinospora gilvigrisea]|uniref:Uncharacterized protein n=1 Tax=Mangrovactinospora gilvigrisea TaxID=1428644 RepID=A0A1J7BDQ2_9ACTN|nr:hypothetical protein [Mangrovactinospora gilvigrisea]OIV36774.1 hypothetical protein BIV57_14475 [Mangrovactinospora gilvigrisea]